MPRNLPFRLGLALLLLGTGPLVLHAILGPADGNPLGPGLLFAASAPVAAGLFLWGLALRDRQKRAGYLRAAVPGSPPSPVDPARPRRNGGWP